MRNQEDAVLRVFEDISWIHIFTPSNHRKLEMIGIQNFTVCLKICPSRIFLEVNANNCLIVVIVNTKKKKIALRNKR